MPLFGPPMHVGLAVGQSGHGWMPGMVLPGSVDVSPVRKMTEESGALMLVVPVAQLTVPDNGGVDSVLVTQTLVGVLPGFGTASGAPKKHPVALQFFWLPVWADVVGPMVATWSAQLVIVVMESPRSGTANGSGTELPPPPV
jgi:hypothetical protein